MSERHRTEQETELLRSCEYLRVLAAFARAVAEPLAAERIMHHAVAQVSSVTEIKHVKIMRCRPDRGDLLVVAGVGWKPGVVGEATLGMDHRSPPGRTMQTGAPVVIEDLPHDEEFRYSDLLRDHGIVSVLNVPIVLDGSGWGVIEADTEIARRFDDRDVAFLVAFANVLGMALARSHSQARAAEAAKLGSIEQANAELRVRELQHRVKNNLQLIVGFLSLKRREARSEETREKLGSVIARVRAVALAHDQLSAGPEPGRVEFSQYLSALCANIDPGHPDIRIELVADRATLPLDRAVPAALVVNECITNSIKYAFDPKGGIIRVSFDVNSDTDEARIAIEDDGRGMPVPPSPGLGLTLVDGFARQLGGRVEFERLKSGTRTTLWFPIVL